MHLTLDRLLLSLALLGPDPNTRFRRSLGDRRSRIVCFLPWRTRFVFARLAGLLPRRFLACYELPSAIVSPEPKLAAQAIRSVAEDAEALVRGTDAAPDRFTIVGLSMGSVPATLLANRLGCRLGSIASADRGDLMIWQSPAAREIKQRAQERGYTIGDYTLALAGLNPTQNLDRIADGSVFITGARDLYVPPRRRAALLKAARRSKTSALIKVFDTGHVETLRRGARSLPILIPEEPMQGAPVASP